MSPSRFIKLTCHPRQIHSPHIRPEITNPLTEPLPLSLERHEVWVFEDLHVTREVNLHHLREKVRCGSEHYARDAVYEERFQELAAEHTSAGGDGGGDARASLLDGLRILNQF